MAGRHRRLRSRNRYSSCVSQAQTRARRLDFENPFIAEPHAPKRGYPNAIMRRDRRLDHPGKRGQGYLGNRFPPRSPPKGTGAIILAVAGFALERRPSERPQQRRKSGGAVNFDSGGRGGFPSKMLRGAGLPANRHGSGWAQVPVLSRAVNGATMTMTRTIWLGLLAAFAALM